MLRFSTPAGDGWLERVWCCGGAGVVDTLLGPEATGLSHVSFGGCVVVVVSFGCPASGRRARLGVLDGGVGLLFENCIVDASIL